MTSAEFDALVECRITQIRKVLTAKAREYASDADCLHNFKRAAQDFSVVPPGVYGKDCPADALVGMMRKHWVSIADLVDRMSPSPVLVDEKIGDAINYLILLEAILKERPE